MKHFLLTVAGVFVGLALFFIALPVVVVGLATAAGRPAPVSDRTVLLLDLRGRLPDQTPQSPLFGLAGRTNSVMSVVRSHRAAEHDDRVKALMVRLPEGGLP